jgi:hypothetical protein
LSQLPNNDKSAKIQTVRNPVGIRSSSKSLGRIEACCSQKEPTDKGAAWWIA